MIASVWAADPVAHAIESYSKVASYRVTLVSKSGDSKETIRYFYEKPGFVRMEFVEPHRGAVLVYDPLKREVKLKPFGFLSFFVMTMGPENRLIKSARGHTVDKSDIGSLLENVKKLQESGSARVEGYESVGDRPAAVVIVEGAAPAPDGTSKYVLWLERKSFLPLKVRAYDNEGRLIEDVLMEDLETGVEFQKGFFLMEEKEE